MPSTSFSKASSSNDKSAGHVETVEGSGNRNSNRNNSNSDSGSNSNSGSSSHATATTTTAATSEAEAWSRVQLLRARLREAAATEDYAAATRIRDALAAAVDALPLPQRHVLAALDAASSPSASSPDRASALLRAADHVRPHAFAQLAAFLHDNDDAVAAAAERALAMAFRVPPDEAAAARMDEGDAALEAAAAAGAMGGGSGGGSGTRSNDHGPPRRRSLLSRAIAAYTSACESHPAYAEAHNARATALYVAGDPEASLRACEVVLDLNPHHFSCAAGAGMCFIALGKHEEALACLEAALAINPRLEHVAATAARMRESAPPTSKGPPSSRSSSSSTARGRLPWLAAREAAARAKAEQQE